MLSNPRVGDRVRVHYRKRVGNFMPWHGRTGVVVVPGRAKPRNHLVRIDAGPLVVVPAGNLNPVHGGEADG